ncbi:MAG: gamma-glutamylputrescine oxidase [Acidimicrobiaceae bacterium]|nr:gamma-glutamylputrescine oxidase [Acidimicrobiaceae bacterium]
MVFGASPIWDDQPDLDLGPLAGPVEADVCVIGLGGSGLAAIDEVLQAGRTVVGIDAGPVAAGAAGRNGGFLLAGMADSHHRVAALVGPERAAALYRATLDEMDRMEAATPDAIRRCGSVRLATTAAEVGDCEQQRTALLGDGFEVEPSESPEGIGLFFPADGSLQPLRRCRTLARAAIDGGARLFSFSPGTAISGTEVEVSAGRGAVQCDAVVVAVDGGLEALIPELHGRVRTARLQMLGTAPLLEMRFPRPVYARWGYDYWQQLPDRSLALGGRRDWFEEQEWTFDRAPSEPVQRALDELLAELSVTAAVTHRWAAVVGYTPDQLPVLEQVRPGVWACGGYSGTGNVVGALCGRAAARLALGLPSEWAALLPTPG